MKDAILFDLDGTLLPMQMEEFTTGYFKLLAKKAAPYGYEPKPLVAALWKGVAAMVANDGSRLNETCFWARFAEELGERVYEHIPIFDSFYANEFDQAVCFTQPNPHAAAEAVRLARQKAERVILATNPIFPASGVRTRLRWINLEPEDFDDVTTYENSSFCKPNPSYYIALLEKNGARPDLSVMIGNDVDEDIAAGRQAGLATYLVTDCAIGLDRPFDGESGSFSDLLDWLAALE